MQDKFSEQNYQRLTCRYSRVQFTTVLVVLADKLYVYVDKLRYALALTVGVGSYMP